MKIKPTYKELEQKIKDLEQEKSEFKLTTNELSDIAELKGSDDILRSSESFSRSILDASPVPMALNDEQQNITFLNPAFIETFGYTLRDIPTLEDWWPQAYPDLAYRAWLSKSWQEELERAKRTGNTFSPMELIVRCKNGTQRTVLASASPLSGSFEGEHLVMLYDITERKQAEFEIERHKSFIQDALDAQNDTFFIFDLHTGKALQWNKAFENISGYSNEEISSLKAPESYYSQKDLEKAGIYIESVLNGGDGTVELELICKDGHRVPSEYSASFLQDAEGNPTNIISIGRDISDRKKAEEEKANLESQLRQAQKLEAIGTMAGGIAHDFNNILAAVIGYAEMARDEIPESSPIREDLEQILRAGNRAKKLVRHILTFSRMSSHAESHFSINLSSIVAEVLKFQRSIIPTTIKIKSDIDENCGQISGNPTQIHQVIMNLCTNASHAMEEEGGTLEVNLHKTELFSMDLKTEPDLRPGIYIQLSVCDTGFGLTPQLIDKIFDPYFTTKKVGKGTGMGLSVVQGIVKNHGGFVKVESEVGNGCIFNVFFPRINEEIISADTDETGDIPTGTERILFVDDEAMLADIGKNMFERLGYSVTTKTDSAEALQLFKNDPTQFDLIITDQTMPSIPGSELAKQLLQIRPDIPIILCTGYSSTINELKAQKIGIREYTMKPVNKNVIARLVRKVLDAS